MESGVYAYGTVIYGPYILEIVPLNTATTN